MRGPFAVALCALSVLHFPTTAAGADIRVSTLPERVLIERAGFDQRLNFDLVLRNDTPEAVEVSAVEARGADVNPELKKAITDASRGR